MSAILHISDRLSDIDKLKDLACGELVYVANEQKIMFWDGENLKDYQGELNLSLYDLNQQLATQLPTCSFEDIQKGKDVIKQYVNETLDDYYLLLCHDLKYITMFIVGQYTTENIEDATIDCLNNIGKIKSIEFTKDKAAIEIWITTEENSYVMYFFKYGEGVVLCN